MLYVTLQLLSPYYEQLIMSKIYLGLTCPNSSRLLCYLIVIVTCTWLQCRPKMPSWRWNWNSRGFVNYHSPGIWGCHLSYSSHLQSKVSAPDFMNSGKRFQAGTNYGLKKLQQTKRRTLERVIQAYEIHIL